MKIRKVAARAVAVGALVGAGALGLGGPALAAGPNHGGKTVTSISTQGNNVTYGYSDGSSASYNMQTGAIVQDDDGSYTNITFTQN